MGKSFNIKSALQLVNFISDLCLLQNPFLEELYNYSFPKVAFCISITWETMGIFRLGPRIRFKLMLGRDLMGASNSLEWGCRVHCITKKIKKKLR